MRGHYGNHSLFLGQAPPTKPPSRHELLREADMRFWQLTKYKPYQNLDMKNPRDRAMARVWMDIYLRVAAEAKQLTEQQARQVSTWDDNEVVRQYAAINQHETDGTNISGFFRDEGTTKIKPQGWLALGGITVLGLVVGSKLLGHVRAKK